MDVARTLLLTRPRGQSEAFAAALEARMPGHFRPLVAPLIDIAPVEAPLDLDGVEGLAFTSANGVEQFAARTTDRSLPAWCVGAMTAAAARAAGFAAVSANGDVAALADLIAARRRPGGGVVLHVRGRHAAGDLVGRLAAAGVAARAAGIYDQPPQPVPAEVAARLAAGGVDVVALFSPRTAALFNAAAAATGWPLAALTAVSLSPAADAALTAPVGRRVVAAEPTREGMLAALQAL